MPQREVFTDDDAELKVHHGEAGSVTISIKRNDTESAITLTLGKEDINDLIQTLSSLSNDTPSIVSIR